MKLEITDNEIGRRIDVAISDLISNFSRSKIQKRIKDGNVSLNGTVINDPSKKVTETCLVEIEETEPEYDYEVIPEKIDLDIVYEDEFIVVVNKKAGMVCHPAPGHKSGTLVNAIAYHFKDSLSDVGGLARPGIVHRLDKDTSGLMLIAKTNEAHMAFSDLFANEKGNLIKRELYGMDGKLREYAITKGCGESVWYNSDGTQQS